MKINWVFLNITGTTIFFQPNYHDHIIRDNIEYQQVKNILLIVQENGMRIDFILKNNPKFIIK